jgi:hypothetical protein
MTVRDRTGGLAFEAPGGAVRSDLVSRTTVLDLNWARSPIVSRA